MNMKKLKLIILLFFLDSCAAGMAVTSGNSVDISDIAIGAKQSEIESRLGFREKTYILNIEERIDYYKFRRGADPSMFRGGVHAAFSLGSGGLWELLGVPYEESINKNKYLAVTYNAENIAIDVKEINLHH